MKKMTDLERLQLFLCVAALLAVVAANTAPWLWLSFVGWFIAIAALGGTWVAYFIGRRVRKAHKKDPTASIGFTVLNSTWDDERDLRVIKEVKLHDASFVIKDSDDPRE